MASEKTLAPSHGAIRLRTPRDRKGEFEPKIMEKNKRRLEKLGEQAGFLDAKEVAHEEIKSVTARIFSDLVFNRHSGTR